MKNSKSYFLLLGIVFLINSSLSSQYSSLQNEKVDNSTYYEPIQEIKTYPNPVGDYLYIQSSGTLGPNAVHIYDINGRELFLSKTMVNGIIHLQTANLLKGFFYIVINKHNNYNTYKFLKE